jgi:hypothetical protein
MLLPLLLSAVLALPTGTIKGSIAPPSNVKISKPIQVVVFSGDYVNLYLAEVQKRVDNYWEEFRGLFIQDKEAFLHFRERAQAQALETALGRMRFDNADNISKFVHNTTNNTFEFHSVPQGECKIVALVTIGAEDFVWSDSVILKDETAFVVLKPTP